MPIPIQFGKHITETSYMHGKAVSHHESIEEAVAVDGAIGALNAIGDAFKKIPKSTNHKITFDVIADHKTMEPIRIVARYQTERSAS